MWVTREVGLVGTVCPLLICPWSVGREWASYKVVAGTSRIQASQKHTQAVENQSHTPVASSPPLTCRDPYSLLTYTDKGEPNTGILALALASEAPCKHSRDTRRRSSGTRGLDERRRTPGGLS